MSTSTVSLDERVQAVARILAGSTDQSTIEKYVARVREILDGLGVTDVSDLDDRELTKEGMLFAAFGCGEGAKPDAVLGDIKPVTFRKALSALRGGIQATAVGNDRLDVLREQFNIKTTIGDISTEHLLSFFDPSLPAEDRITRELKGRYKDEAVLLFEPGTKKLDIAATIRYIRRLADGQSALETVLVRGAFVKPVRVGEVPDKMLDEDPFFPGEVLDDGISAHNYIDWVNVPMEVRQFCRILRNRNEFDPSSPTDTENIKALIEGGLKALANVYKRADVDFREAQVSNDLPKLKLKVNGSTRKNDPFRGKNKSY